LFDLSWRPFLLNPDMPAPASPAPTLSSANSAATNGPNASTPRSPNSAAARASPSRSSRPAAPNLDRRPPAGALRRPLKPRFALVSLAEKRLTDTEELRRLADDVGAAVRRNDGRGYIETDRAFHLALVSRANNPMLTKMIMEVRDSMRL
jgi:hypothetical protein